MVVHKNYMTEQQVAQQKAKKHLMTLWEQAGNGQMLLEGPAKVEKFTSCIELYSLSKKDIENISNSCNALLLDFTENEKEHSLKIHNARDFLAAVKSCSCRNLRLSMRLHLLDELHRIDQEKTYSWQEKNDIPRQLLHSFSLLDDLCDENGNEIDYPSLQDSIASLNNLPVIQKHWLNFCNSIIIDQLI